MFCIAKLLLYNFGMKEYIPTGKTFTCRECKEIKDTCEFPPDEKQKSGHSNRCRACAREYARARRERLGPIANVTNNRKRELIRKAKSQPCADCGNTFPYFVMDLDHLPEYEKSFRLAVAASYPMDQIVAELKKCEAVCANCHRYRTAKRSGMV